MNRAGQITHVLLRIVAGFLFMQHGGQKLFGWYGGGGGAGASLPPMTLQNKGETAALFSFIFFFFAGNGAGRFSLDAMLRGRASARTRIPAPISEAVDAWERDEPAA